jgi:membrane fusion protein (multidrug efflux system)
MTDHFPAASRSAFASRSPRARQLVTLAAVALVIAAGWAVYEWQVGSRFESTDNAYVQGNLVQITPQIGGTVTAILVDDTDFVKAGQPLVQLDPADVRLALQQAEAGLAQAVRQARTLYLNTGALAAQVTLRQTEATRAQAEVSRLTGEAAVAPTLAQARSALTAAEAALLAAREQLAAHQALTEGATVQTHPTVQAAAARLREAWLASQRLALPAPVEGYVARRTVQLGQRVPAGMPLMTLVPLQQVWVDANFKEGQLRRLRVGQPVRLTADVYGRQVVYRGTVEGLGAGTGAAFALLPAQNATGNWIKVVQRVPVRIALDPAELARHPLRVGLSMQAEVDVSRQDGPSLQDRPGREAGAQTQALSVDEAAAEALVRRVIQAHLGTPTQAGAR